MTSQKCSNDRFMQAGLQSRNGDSKCEGISRRLFRKICSTGFNLVAADRRPNRPKAHVRDRVDLPLRGSLRCGSCGHTMTGYFATGCHGGKFGYYGCYNKQCANRVTVPKQKVEDVFAKHLRQWQPTSGAMRLVTHVVTKRWKSRQDLVRHATTIKEI